MADLKNIVNTPEYVDFYKSRTKRDAPNTGAFGPTKSNIPFDTQSYLKERMPSEGAFSENTVATVDPKFSKLLEEDDRSWLNPMDWFASEEGANAISGRGSRGYIGAFDTPEVRFEKLKEAYGDYNVLPDETDETNFLIKDGEDWKRYNPRGLDWGDITSTAIPEISGLIGSILGAGAGTVGGASAGSAVPIVGTAAGGVAGGVAGAGTGYSAGRNLGRELQTMLYGDFDNEDAGIIDNPSGFGVDTAMGSLGQAGGIAAAKAGTAALNAIKNTGLSPRYIASKIPGLSVEAPAEILDENISKMFQGDVADGWATPGDFNTYIANITGQEPKIVNTLGASGVADASANARISGAKGVRRLNESDRTTSEGADRFFQDQLGINDVNLNFGNLRDRTKDIMANARNRLRNKRNLKAGSQYDSEAMFSADPIMDAIGRVGRDTASPSSIPERVPLFDELVDITTNASKKYPDGSFMRREGSQFEAPVIDPNLPVSIDDIARNNYKEISGRFIPEINTGSAVNRILDKMFDSRLKGPDLAIQNESREALFEAIPGFRDAMEVSRPFSEIMSDQVNKGFIKATDQGVKSSKLNPIAKVLKGQSIPEKEALDTMAELFDSGLHSADQLQELARDMIGSIGNASKTDRLANSLLSVTESQNQALSALITIAETDPKVFGKALTKKGSPAKSKDKKLMKDWLKDQYMDSSIKRGSSKNLKNATDRVNQALTRLNVGKGVADRRQLMDVVNNPTSYSAGSQNLKNMQGANVAASLGAVSASGGMSPGAIASLSTAPVSAIARMSAIPKAKASIAFGESKAAQNAMNRAMAKRAVIASANDEIGVGTSLSNLFKEYNPSYREALNNALRKRIEGISKLDEMSVASGIGESGLEDTIPSVDLPFVPSYMKPETIGLRNLTKEDMIYSGIPTAIRSNRQEEDTNKARGAF